MKDHAIMLDYTNYHFIHIKQVIISIKFYHFDSIIYILKFMRFSLFRVYFKCIIIFELIESFIMRTSEISLYEVSAFFRLLQFNRLFSMVVIFSKGSNITKNSCIAF